MFGLETQPIYRISICCLKLFATTLYELSLLDKVLELLSYKFMWVASFSEGHCLWLSTAINSLRMNGVQRVKEEFTSDICLVGSVVYYSILDCEPKVSFRNKIIPRGPLFHLNMELETVSKILLFCCNPKFCCLSHHIAFLIVIILCKVIFFI